MEEKHVLLKAAVHYCLGRQRGTWAYNSWCSLQKQPKAYIDFDFIKAAKAPMWSKYFNKATDSPPTKLATKSPTALVYDLHGGMLATAWATALLMSFCPAGHVVVCCNAEGHLQLIGSSANGKIAWQQRCACGKWALCATKNLFVCSWVTVVSLLEKWQQGRHFSFHFSRNHCPEPPIWQHCLQVIALMLQLLHGEAFRKLATTA